MSESDDTDVLLLIPPDFFNRSSSDSEVSSSIDGKNYPSQKSGVISELVGHMQFLESRIHAIESRDNSLDVSLLNTSLDSHFNSSKKHNQTPSNPRHTCSLTPSLQNTPIKPQKSSSVPLTPNGFVSSSSNYANPPHNNNAKETNDCGTSTVNTNVNANPTKPINLHITRCKHDALVSYPDSSVLPLMPCDKRYAYAASSKKETYSSLPLDCCTYKNYCNNQSYKPPNSNSSSSTLEKNTLSRNIKEMELAEINLLLQEMEATESELSRKVNHGNVLQSNEEQTNPLYLSQNTDMVSNGQDSEGYKNVLSNRKFNFHLLPDKESYNGDQPSSMCPDIPFSTTHSLQFDETDKLISEFKTWDHNPQSRIQSNSRKPNEIESSDIMSRINSIGIQQNTMNMQDMSFTNRHNVHELKNSENTSSMEGIKPIEDSSIDNLSEACKISSYFGAVPHLCNDKCAHLSTNTECIRKSQRFLSLSDFWDTNTNRSQEETLKIKLEEEKFRREHCEHLIQELQKRLLEQQEKVAVAVRVDNEKNLLITQFHNAWVKIKKRVKLLESEYQKLQTNLKNETEKHQTEISELQAQIKRSEGELSKALDLAAGYKSKSDSLMQEKVALLKSHADELESYKSLVQEAENRCDQLKEEYNKLFEKNQKTEEAMKTVQQELNRERLRNGEVRNEMAVIHKALDACEAELTVLRQEKEGLQLKLKEEVNRNSILENKIATYLESVNDAKKAEKMAKDEVKSLAEQQEKIRRELQEVYQNQVDEVVKKKLQEFQNQLDSAESEFLEELKTRQKVIAESAARKVKDVIDKHQLEIKLLEEKHKEEKRLYELQLVQATQKSLILESQLNSQRTTKSQLAEQLHSVMQKQWQQALKIISGGNVENLAPSQKINMDKFIDSRDPRKSESMPNCYTKISLDAIKMGSQASEKHRYNDKHGSTMTLTSNDETPVSSRKEFRDDLRKYVKMVSEMQEAREEFSKFQERVSSPTNCREIPRKNYVKKELSISEDSMAWQPVSESSVHDISEYIPIPQKLTSKSEQKNKPPWK